MSPQKLLKFLTGGNSPSTKVSDGDESSIATQSSMQLQKHECEITSKKNEDKENVFRGAGVEKPAHESPNAEKNEEKAFSLTPLTDGGSVYMPRLQLKKRQEQQQQKGYSKKSYGGEKKLSLHRYESSSSSSSATPKSCTSGCSNESGKRWKVSVLSSQVMGSLNRLFSYNRNLPK